jgi:hypothetical protein
MTPTISSRDVLVVQIPDANNNYHAICNVRVITSSGQFSSIGEAQGSQDTAAQGLLQQAERDGYERVLSMVKVQDNMNNMNHHESFVTWNEEPHISFSDSKPSPIRASPGNEGGGLKPITLKQEEAIMKLCAKKHLDYKDFIHLQYDKDLHQLQGNEAHNIIQELNKL